MKKEIIRHEEGAAPFPQVSSLFSFVPPIKAGNQIFIALASGTGTTFEEQFTNILKEVEWSLESQGSSMANVVTSTVYFTNFERDVEKAHEVYGKFFPSDNPNAVAWIGIKDLYPTKPPQPPLLVEMTLTAIIPDE